LASAPADESAFAPVGVGIVSMAYGGSFGGVLGRRWRKKSRVAQASRVTANRIQGDDDVDR
jgi:hypothetical protein